MPFTIEPPKILASNLITRLGCSAIEVGKRQEDVLNLYNNRSKLHSTRKPLSSAVWFYPLGVDPHHQDMALMKYMERLSVLSNLSPLSIKTPEAGGFHLGYVRVRSSRTAVNRREGRFQTHGIGNRGLHVLEEGRKAAPSC